MPYLTVVTDDNYRRVCFEPGPSVREILDATDTRVRCGCRGNGLCGLCLIRIEAGEVNPPTPNERLMLQPQQLQQNVRLACQVLPDRDIAVRIINIAPASNWRSLPPTAMPAMPGAIARPEGGYGVAVDLGTTHISLTLWDRRQGVRIAGRVGLNPQSRYGADVMTRLVTASESSDDARGLAQTAFDAIREAMLDICVRHGVDAGQIVHVTIVANTAMLALLTGADANALLRPRAWTQEAQFLSPNNTAWVGALGLHSQAVVEIIPPLAGFVGSDLLAGVLATRLTDRPGSLLVDFGTNSEIALWDGKTLWATSAAGGPAFEGSGIPGGMPAESGAIRRVTQAPGSSDLQYQVIDDGLARGICGSGLVDLIACLLRTGKLTPKGKFTAAEAGDFAIRAGDTVIPFDARGVDMFQRAKAAIGVGIRKLLDAAGMGVSQLERVCVCGAFGRYLDVRNAQEVGLLPSVPPGQVELCGNTALGGCEMLLLSQQASADLAAMRKRAMIINLAQATDFDTVFMECLYLQPLEVNAS